MHRPIRTAMLLALLVALALLALACSSSDDDDGGTTAAAATEAGGDAPQQAATTIEGVDHLLKQPVDMSLTVTSPTFNEKRRIGKKHTCTRMSANDPNISPPFGWEGVPDGTASIAIIMDSLEAPGDLPWVHWVIWNIPPDVTELPEGSPSQDLLSRGVRQGTNEAGEIGYVGPCPPAIISTNGATGDMPRTVTQGVKAYYFTVYALDKTLDLQDGATKQQLLDDIDGRVLASGRLKGERHGTVMRRNQ